MVGQGGGCVPPEIPLPNSGAWVGMCTRDPMLGTPHWEQAWEEPEQEGAHPHGAWPAVAAPKLPVPWAQKHAGGAGQGPQRQDATPCAGAWPCGRPPRRAHTPPSPLLRPMAPGSTKQPRLPRTEKNHQQQIFYFQLPAKSVPVVLASWAAAASAGGSLAGGHGRVGPSGVLCVSSRTAGEH